VVVCGFDYTAGSHLDFAIAVCDFSLAAGAFPPVKAFSIFPGFATRLPHSGPNSDESERS